MSKKYMYLFGAALLALSGVGASAQSAQAKGARHVRRTNVTRNYQRYFVTAPLSVSSNARTISGKATPGIHVTLQNGRKVIAGTYASKTGRYVLNVPKRFHAGTMVRVMAKKGYQHPFRDVVVKTPANQKAAIKANKKASRKPVRKAVKKSAKRAKVARKTNRKAANKRTKRQAKKVTPKQNAKRVTRKARAKVNRKRTRKPVKKVARKTSRKANPVTIKDPNGTWQTRASKRGYVQKWNLSQKRGLNESLYRNGKFVKKLVTNATYKVNVKNNNWQITYRAHGQKKAQRMTMHFLTNNHFNLTNQNGRRASLAFLRA